MGWLERRQEGLQEGLQDRSKGEKWKSAQEHRQVNKIANKVKMLKCQRNARYIFYIYSFADSESALASVIAAPAPAPAASDVAFCPYYAPRFLPFIAAE